MIIYKYILFINTCYHKFIKFRNYNRRHLTIKNQEVSRSISLSLIKFMSNQRSMRSIKVPRARSLQVMLKAKPRERRSADRATTHQRSTRMKSRGRLENNPRVRRSSSRRFARPTRQCYVDSIITFSASGTRSQKSNATLDRSIPPRQKLTPLPPLLLPFPAKGKRAIFLIAESRDSEIATR